jgi:hypothetical protein
MAVATTPLVLVVTSCSGSADSSGGPSSSDSQSGDRGPTASAPHSIASTPPTVAPTSAGLPTFTEGVGLSEWLPYDDLTVRVLDYEPAVVPATGSGDRIDSIEVEECASRARPATVTHQSWSLADTSDVTLGLAGGKLVDGTPTEDPPLHLEAGECAKTFLAIGVPADSRAVFAHDGPDTTWVL